MIEEIDKPAIAKYIAFLKQTGTNVPTAYATFINTYKDITLTRISAGKYEVRSNTGKFTVGKTIANNSLDGTNPIMIATSSNYNALYQVWPLNAYTINVWVIRASDLAFIDLSTLGDITLPINIQTYNYITPTI